MIDRDIHLARALIVEGNALLRSVGTSQLRDAGVGHVAHVSRVQDARLVLERESFDIVVCNREFEGSDYSGQDLLDELRRERLLPHSTVFVMVMEQVSYVQVVEAAEAALDAFLVRPYTAATLCARLLEARNRKRELGDILRALDAGEQETALVRAVKRFQEKQPYWVYCGRLAAELLLTLQRPQDAGRVFEKLAQAKPGASWAPLGQARALMAHGDNGAARRIVNDIIAAEPSSADAHDLLGRLLVEASDFDGALVEYRRAVDLTPGCLLRTQHAGALAFYQGHAADALKWLERTLQMGVQSKLFDALSLMLLAMLRHDKGDAAGVSAMADQLRRFRERFPQSRRLQRFEASCNSLRALLSGRAEDTLQWVRALADEADQDDFDLEAANVLFALWARIPSPWRPADEHRAVLEKVAMRFCVGRAIGEALAASAGREEIAVDAIKYCQARISAATQEAMELSLRGEPAAAAEQLLRLGEQTLNAKLLEMAGLIVGRHAALIPDATALNDRVSRVLRCSCQTANHIAGIQRSGRSTGGLQWRGRQATESAAATA